FVTNADVRVVVGLPPLLRAIAEIERLPETARTPGVAASHDEITDMVTPHANAEVALRRVRGFVWKMEDRSDTGCRLTAPAKESPVKLGEILALKEGDSWALAAVRRMQRHQVDEPTVGV